MVARVPPAALVDWLGAEFGVMVEVATGDWVLPAGADVGAAGTVERLVAGILLRTRANSQASHERVVSQVSSSTFITEYEGYHETTRSSCAASFWYSSVRYGKLSLSTGRKLL